MSFRLFSDLCRSRTAAVVAAALSVSAPAVADTTDRQVPAPTHESTLTFREAVAIAQGELPLYQKIMTGSLHAQDRTPVTIEICDGKSGDRPSMEREDESRDGSSGHDRVVISIAGLMSLYETMAYYSQALGQDVLSFKEVVDYVLGQEIGHQAYSEFTATSLQAASVGGLGCRSAGRQTNTGTGWI